MARTTGTAPFAVNFEPGCQAPLDARAVVAASGDLMTAFTQTRAVYTGMAVVVAQDNCLAILKDKDAYLAAVDAGSADPRDYWEFVYGFEANASWAEDNYLGRDAHMTPSDLEGVRTAVETGRTGSMTRAPRYADNAALAGVCAWLDELKLDASALAACTEADIDALFS